MKGGVNGLDDAFKIGFYFILGVETGKICFEIVCRFILAIINTLKDKCKENKNGT